MFIVRNPGPWQTYHQKHSNSGLSLDQIRQKYLREHMLYEQQQYEDYLNWSRIQVAGGPTEIVDNEYVAFDYVVGDYFE